MIRRKNFLSIVAMLTMCAMLVTFGMPVIASAALTEEAIIEIADEYVYFDSSSNRYVLDQNIRNVLSRSQVSVVEDKLKLSNINLADFIRESKDESLDDDISLSVADAHGNAKTLKQGRVSKGYGVTSVTLYWNYANIKLNRDHARLAFGSALVIAGAVITKGTGHSIITDLLGVWSAFLIPHGIWFHYNYFYGALSQGVYYKGITKAGWQ